MGSDGPLDFLQTLWLEMLGGEGERMNAMSLSWAGGGQVRFPGHPLHARGLVLYKPRLHLWFPSALQSRADGGSIPFKRMGKLRSRELQETFFQGCILSGGEMLKSGVPPR